MGSQSRRSTRRRGRGGRGGGGGSGGGGGGSGGTSEGNERERVYRIALARANAALKSRNFSYAARIATSVAVSRTPVQDTLSLFLAGARAFNEGKEKRWEPRPPELAADGIQYAQEKTGYELTLERRRFFISILSENLRKAAEKHGRKQP